jgi:hypothetical protein
VVWPPPVAMDCGVVVGTLALGLALVVDSGGFAGVAPDYLIYGSGTPAALLAAPASAVVA